METIKLTIPSNSLHGCQIITGFLRLRQQGQAVETVNRSKDRSNPFYGLPVVLAEYRGQRIIYDLWDGYQDPDDMKKGLEMGDFYFKRSFSPVKNESLFAEYSEKIHPLGFNYHVTHRENPVGEPWWKAALKPLMGRTPDRRFTTEVFEGTAVKTPQKDVKILFLAGLWDDNDPTLSPELNAERTRINEMRIEIIRTLRQCRGPQFIGGLNDTALSRRLAPELIVPAQYTERRKYLSLMHTCDICIGSMGLHESIGWKTGEYVAAAKAIVNERFHYEVPGNFTPGVHYLSFTTAAECIENVQRLADSPEALYAMKQANEAYYQNYLKPEALVKNTLTVVDRALDR